MKMNEDRIIQVIPCTKPMIAVWDDENHAEYGFSYVRYLGLTIRGEIVQINFSEGWAEPIFSNEKYYLGLWEEDSENFKGELFYGHFLKWKENQGEH